MATATSTDQIRLTQPRKQLEVVVEAVVEAVVEQRWWRCELARSPGFPDEEPQLWQPLLHPERSRQLSLS